MNKILENNKGVNLMIWETNPRLRNNGNPVKLVIQNHIGINEGDVICGIISGEKKSFYLIENIIDRRPALLDGYEYVTCKTSWSNKKPSFENMDYSYLSERLKDFFY